MEPLFLGGRIHVVYYSYTHQSLITHTTASAVLNKCLQGEISFSLLVSM